MRFDFFCEELSKRSDENVLRILEVPLSRFSNVSHLIHSNPDDKKNGVTQVFLFQDQIFFNGFDTVIHKVYENEKKQYFFYTVTNNTSFIFYIVDVLVSLFGEGFLSIHYSSSATDRIKIDEISKGIFYSTDDTCETEWILIGGRKIILQYRVEPLQQFVLIIEEE